MSEGTPIDALESGDVKDAADSRAMQEIMRDMNLGNEQAASAPPTLQMNVSTPMPMPAHVMNTYTPPQQHQNYYVPVHDETPARAPKKNVWSTAVSMIRDPLVVGLLFFVLSLPVLHTFLAKYAGWAFAVGGQLSWLGLGAFSAITALIFGLYQGLTSMLGF
jgi:hypothetical protein